MRVGIWDKRRKGPGNARGRTTCLSSPWVPRACGEHSWRRSRAFSGSHRGWYTLHPAGHVRVRFKNGTWAGPNGFQSSLWALSVLVRGLCDQGICLPSLVTWGTTPGWCCQNQDKREKPVKTWTWPSSWEQVTYSNYSPVCAPHPQCSMLGFQGLGHHSVDWPRGRLFPLSLPPTAFPLGGSQPEGPDSLLQCHKDQQFKPLLDVFLPSLPSFLYHPVKAVERRGNGGMRAQGFDTSQGFHHSVKSGQTSGMTQEAVTGRWVRWDSGGREEDEDRHGVEGGGERWERHKGVEARQRETLCWLTYQGRWCTWHFCQPTSLLVPAVDPCPSPLQTSPGIMGNTHMD